MKYRKVSIGKDSLLNEDSVLADSLRIAVSDGAGGGGLFADKWSAYLLQQLPNHPILNFNELDAWIDSIWEPLYIHLESIAKDLGSIELNKFYDEGSLATLAALWVDKSEIKWLSYGDSVIFCYDFDNKELASSVIDLNSFNNAPSLININSPLNEEGFECGTFPISDSKLYFCATDALAHYIIVSYMASKQSVYKMNLLESLNAMSKNTNFIKAIISNPNINFEKDVIIKIFNCAINKSNFFKHVRKLQRNGKVAVDDCTIAFIYQF